MFLSQIWKPLITPSAEFCEGYNIEIGLLS